MITPSFSATATERVLPRLALDFTTGVLDSRIAVARALNTATCVNSSGYIAGVNANLPRFDYDPVTLASKGLLIEETRSNLLTYSDQFNNANWSKAVTVNADATVSPDGTTNADKITKTAVAYQSVYQSVTSSAGTIYTVSVYFKADTLNRVSIAVISGTTDVRYWFDLAAKTVGGAIGSFTTGYVGSSIQDAGNGWLRCTLTVTAQSTSTNAYFYPDKADTANAGSVFIYGAQLEAGSFATSYIPTTNVALTRNFDNVSMTGTNFSDWFNTTRGTFVMNCSVLSVDATKRRYAWFVSDSGSTRLCLRAIDGGGFANPVAAIGTGTTAVGLSGTTFTVNTATKIAVAYGANMALVQNAGNPVTNANTASVAGTTLIIGGGGGAGGNELCGHVRSLYVYVPRLLNAEAQAFTK